MRNLISWGRFPYHFQNGHPCFWRKDIPILLSSLKQNYGTSLPFGNGLSYGDSCLATSDHVLSTQTLGRFIKADWNTGVVIAEAGVTLEEVLIQAIPRGWFLPVTPGTKFVTLGGALANDVHGKNHHKSGTFGCHVLRFSLVRSDRAAMICSPTENCELFAATIGGLGLTGVIEWIELKLKPIQSSSLNVSQIRFDSLAEFFALSDAYDKHHEYSVAWVDCLAKGKACGRGVFIFGDHATDGSLQINQTRKLSIPLTPPFSLINKLTLRLFNSTFFHVHKRGETEKVMSYDPFFYPLDKIHCWNRIYGRRGFQQYQCVIPDQMAEGVTRELLKVIADAGCGSFLAVLKRFGDRPSPGILSFPLPGVTLALDFPQHERLNRDLFPRLDTIVRESNGRLYPAKDAHMSGTDFRHFYPNWKLLETWRDPALQSRFWKRVTTV